MINVLIVDDQKTIQQVLKTYIEVEPDLKIVGFAENGQVAIEKIEPTKPDVILMDIDMPVMDGLSATQIIAHRFTATKVLIFSLYDEDEYLYRALEVGAKGYLLKTTPPEEIINAIRYVHKGYFQLGPSLLEKYLSKITKFPSNTEQVNLLKETIESKFKTIEEFGNSSKDLHSKLEKNLTKKINFETKTQEIETELYYLKSKLYKLENNLIIIRKFLFLFSIFFTFVFVLVYCIYLISF